MPTPHPPPTLPHACAPPSPPQYWDDPSDALRPEEGTLLPLWGDKDGGAFASPRVKRRAVTALAWSPRYPDLFAAGYGSYDALAPTTGLVCCYSLKSPCRPELAAATASSVVCLEFHPDHSSLLAVGCHDGAILVFDLRSGKACWAAGRREGGPHRAGCRR